MCTKKMQNLSNSPREELESSQFLNVENSKENNQLSEEGEDSKFETEKDEPEVNIHNVVEGDLLDRSPPDFRLAMIHRHANMVKNLNMAELKSQSFNNKEQF